MLTVITYTEVQELNAQIPSSVYMDSYLLADRTAAHSMIAYCHGIVLCMSVHPLVMKCIQCIVALRSV